MLLLLLLLSSSSLIRIAKIPSVNVFSVKYLVLKDAVRDLGVQRDKHLRSSKDDIARL